MMRKSSAALSCALILVLLSAAVAEAQNPLPFGRFPSGPLDAITDVRGVKVGHVTKIAGAGALHPGKGPIRTGATAVFPNADPWNHKVSAATFDLNGNGEMSGTHWIREAGYLETPVVLTDTLDVGKADDGVVSWMLQHYPEVGITDDVPLPVVAECDDQALNDIRGRHVESAEIAGLLDSVQAGQFVRGNVGAGTGMRAFGFKGGIGSASRVVHDGTASYRVGVLLNLNSGSRSELTVRGTRVGEALRNELLPVFPKRVSISRGRATDGSVIVIVATDAPLESRQLEALAKRTVLGLARTGLTSHVSSGDLMLAFSTTRVFERSSAYDIAPPSIAPVTNGDTVDMLYAAAAEATEAAVYDALFSARTMSGANGATFYALPIERVRAILAR